MGAQSVGLVVYTYQCVDGFVRTRCRRHIEQSGPYAIVQRERATYHLRPHRGRCVRCDWEAEQDKRATKHLARR